MSKPYKSSIVYSDHQMPRKDQYKLSNWSYDGIFWILILALIILKTLIYIKDEKRDGK